MTKLKDTNMNIGTDLNIPETARKARWMEPQEIKLTRTAGGFLDLEYDGETYERIAIHRSFPLSLPDDYLSFRQAGEKAEEIGMLRKLSDLDKGAQELVREQLALRYFTPVMTKINSVKEEYGYTYWDVETDRGPVRFVVRMGSGTVNRIGGTRYMVNDIDGNRFEIRDLNAFSAAEQKKLDMFV